MNACSATISGLVLLLGQPLAHAAELRVWTSRAGATVLAEIGPEFERATGHKVDVAADLPDPFLKRARAGESFDLMISTAGPIDALIAEGKLLADTRTPFARSAIGVAVRKGARKPDISSVEAFKRAVLDAKSIAYLKVGSGIYLHDLFQRWGIAESIAAKATRPDSDIVSELVAQGKVELGLVVSTQILTTPGADLVGPLPQQIQHYVMFVGAIAASSKAPDAARELMTFLGSPRALAVIEAQGMEPGASDETAVRELVTRWERAWNKHDMDELFSLVTDDADFVNVGARHWKGRQEIQAEHAKRLNQFIESTWSTGNVTVQFLEPHVALAHVDWTLRGDKDPDGTVRPPRGGVFTWVVMKQGGAWLIRAAQNTNLGPMQGQPK